MPDELHKSTENFDVPAPIRQMLLVLQVSLYHIRAYIQVYTYMQAYTHTIHTDTQ